MTEYNVSFEGATANDISHFVATVNRYDFDCRVVVGHYAVNAKSIMAMFSLDFSKELKLRVYTDDPLDLPLQIAKYTA